MFLSGDKQQFGTGKAEIIEGADQKRQQQRDNLIGLQTKSAIPVCVCSAKQALSASIATCCLKARTLHTP